MKKINIAATLAACSIVSTSAMAENVVVKACTKDGHTATLHAQVFGNVSTPGSKVST